MQLLSILLNALSKEGAPIEYRKRKILLGLIRLMPRLLCYEGDLC